MKQTLQDFGLKFDHIPVKCDNTSAISLSKNPIQHSSTKHIEMRHHFLKDHMMKSDVILRGVHDSVRFGLDSKNQPNRVILIL